MPTLAVSIGEPSGIGPEVIIAAWRMRKAAALPAFYVLGDAALLAARAGRLGLNIPIVETTPAEAAARFDAALPVVPLENWLVDAPRSEERREGEGCSARGARSAEQVTHGG